MLILLKRHDVSLLWWLMMKLYIWPSRAYPQHIVTLCTLMLVIITDHHSYVCMMWLKPLCTAVCWQHYCLSDTHGTPHSMVKENFFLLFRHECAVFGTCPHSGVGKAMESHMNILMSSFSLVFRYLRTSIMLCQSGDLSIMSTTTLPFGWCFSVSQSLDVSVNQC